MQIFVPFLIVGSVLGFHKGFHKFILGGAVLMDYVSCLKHLALDYELGCGVFLFGRFKQVYRLLGLFLLFGFGFKFVYSYDFHNGVIRFFCNLRAKYRNLKSGFRSNHAFDGKCGKSSEMEKIEKSNSPSDSDGEFVAEEDDDDDGELDIRTLRQLLKNERQKLKEVEEELAKERSASATAAEEAMTMILRLQKEKSLLEMEWSQYRRLAEEKQIHDQEVIRSLQWLVWQHEHQRRFLNMEDDDDVADTCINGNILDVLENVLYSSRDPNSL